MKSIVKTFNVLLGIIFLVCNIYSSDYKSNWQYLNDRIWIGAEYWSNPLEDWQVKDGKVLCTSKNAERDLQILTQYVSNEDGSFSVSAITGLIEADERPTSSGFKLCIQSELEDYRSSLFFPVSQVNVGITGEGILFVDEFTKETTITSIPSHGVKLKVKGFLENGEYTIGLIASDPLSGIDYGSIEKKGYAKHLMHGNLALANNFNINGKERYKSKIGKVKMGGSWWYSDWEITGSKIREDQSRKFGPILFTMYTQSRKTLKLTAQMPPLGADDFKKVSLVINKKGEWDTIQNTDIYPLANTATFKIEGWNTLSDVQYKIVYSNKLKNGKLEKDEYIGTIRKEPISKNEISVAGFTGIKDYTFPHSILVNNVDLLDPDMLFFSGDQIYESVGKYPISGKTEINKMLSYHRKFWMFGWAFREIMRDRPTVVLPDDHDMFQGNIWGNGGNPVERRDHQMGGFVLPPDIVNAIIRTQTSHHPDAYDPTPMKQGIDVFYADMLYGGISFAIIEDRYFKSGPKQVAEWEGRPDWILDENYDVSKVDRPGLVLLGDRQLIFLSEWTTDWREAYHKVLLSQTIFVNLANYHGPKKKYIKGDMDSNGWPQTARNKALKTIRKGFVFHYAGDQHLASITHYGVDEWSDAGFAFCVPSVAAGYPRSWLPDLEGRPVQNRINENLPNTGEYLDGLGNLITVHAIGNPELQNKENLSPLLKMSYKKASGFGILKLNKDTREITMECWNSVFDARNPKPTDQLPGWPQTINLYDNYGKKAQAWLPEITVKGLKDPVIQVINETSNQIVYTLRIQGQTYKPKVFEAGSYKVIVGDQIDNIKEIKGLIASDSQNEKLTIEF